MRAIVAGFPVLLWSGLIFWASSRQVVPDTGISFPHSDKVVHAGVFGVWAATFAFALTRARWPRTPAWRGFAIVLGTCLWGISDEIHQSFVPTREADLWDVVADTSGALLFVIVWQLCMLLRRGPPTGSGAGPTVAAPARPRSQDPPIE